jgi:hypothetical protein
VQLSTRIAREGREREGKEGKKPGQKQGEFQESALAAAEHIQVTLWM